MTQTHTRLLSVLGAVARVETTIPCEHRVDALELAELAELAVRRLERDLLRIAAGRGGEQRGAEQHPTKQAHSAPPRRMVAKRSTSLKSGPSPSWAAEAWD